MLIHQVFFHFREGLPPDELTTVKHSLLAMKEVIAEIREARWRVNTSREERDCGFKYGITLAFDGQRELDAYLTHPHHQDVCRRDLFPALASIHKGLMVFDYQE
ncbi:Dabb family protein [Martelella alba]|uniref:Dabb family protein n=1 Tax=Martelella alba TaxID=2590451 RepID=A0ABY2SGL9_9HYPH|nr:Dabb family protein [Martelella alba]TKI03365.1 Dabb family protein [Martelella alba]